MTALRFPSIMKAIKASLHGVLHNTLAFSSSEPQFDRAKERITRDYRSVVAQRIGAGGASLDRVVEDNIGTIIGNKLGHPYSTGDTDLLSAYAKFSIFEYPSLPIVVNNLRDTLGRHKVSDVLTEEHLEVHRRLVSACEEALITDDVDDAMERKLNKLAVFVLSNMDDADGILSIVEQRSLINPKDIAAVLQQDGKAPALMEGFL